MKKVVLLLLCAALLAALILGAAFVTKKETETPVENAGTAQNAEALVFLGTGVIGNLQESFLLNHFPVPPYLAFSTISTTRQRLSLLRGRVSITLTVSPIPHSLFSSWALSL